MDAVDIDSKLCLTAAIVGARTRKDLAAAFRRANPRTSFDVERANKWLQGRARPREQQIYEDWALLLGEGATAPWVAEASFAEFARRVCAGRDDSAETLLRRARAFGGDSARLAVPTAAEAGAATGMVGVFASYSFAWSPYFPGRIIRGSLVVAPEGAGLAATYAQARASDRLVARGPVTLMRRATLIDLHEPMGRTAFHFTLFPPSALVSVLGGLIVGPAVLGADPQPSVSRVALVRLPAATERLLGADCVLDQGASLAADLQSLGAVLPDPDEAERRLSAFLNHHPGGPYDHVTMDSFRALVAVFDRQWLADRPPA